MSDKCTECGSIENLKHGWTNALYCSERCERLGVASLHAGMPGGPSPYEGWVPSHISREIIERWKESEQ